MTTFPDQLAALRQRATKPVNSVASFCEVGEANQKLALFLANHSEAIEKVVRAANEREELSNRLNRCQPGAFNNINAQMLEAEQELRAALNELEGK